MSVNIITQAADNIFLDLGFSAKEADNLPIRLQLINAGWREKNYLQDSFYSHTFRAGKKPTLKHKLITPPLSLQKA